MTALNLGLQHAFSTTEFKADHSNIIFSVYTHTHAKLREFVNRRPDVEEKEVAILFMATSE